MLRSLTFVLSMIALPVVAQITLDLGQATETYANEKNFFSYKMPVGPAGEGQTRLVVAEGALTHRVWEVPIEESNTLQLIDRLRQEFESSGFEVLFECETRACGGFDFRFETLIAPAPAMHVDLGDFRYLALQRLGQSVPEYMSFLVSRSGARGYVQMIHVGLGEGEEAFTTPIIEENISLKSALERDGYVVLDDLEFKTGSAELGDGTFATLSELAAFLTEFPQRDIILVGHTDAQGALDSNIALSKLRAQSVANRLINDLDVDPDQLRAEGVGFLSPITSNLTQDGRTKNRRVEAVLASTQ